MRENDMWNLEKVLDFYVQRALESLEHNGRNYKFNRSLGIKLKKSFRKHSKNPDMKNQSEKI